MGGVIFFLVVGLALIPGYIAREKGRDFLLWWFFGIVALIPAVVVALLIEEQRACASCGAKVKASSAFCQACGTRLPERHAPVDEIADASVKGMTPMQREVLRQRAQRTKS